MVSPIVEGTKHKKIETTGDKGFAITLVPESVIGPHMAQGGLKRYYKRSGDSFYPMEHFDIEDMFGRRKKPKLSLYTNIVGGGTTSGPSGKTYRCHIILGIENVGRGTARYPYLAIKVHPPYEIDLLWGLDGNGNHGLPILPKGGGLSGFVQFGANTDIVIHPNTIYPVTKIRFDIPKNTEKLEDVIIESKMISEDIRYLEERTVIKGSKIIKQILPKIDSGG